MSLRCPGLIINNQGRRPSFVKCVTQCESHCLTHRVPHCVTHRVTHYVTYCVTHCVAHRVTHCVTHRVNARRNALMCNFKIYKNNFSIFLIPLKDIGYKGPGFGPTVLRHHSTSNKWMLSRPQVYLILVLLYLPLNIEKDRFF